MSLADDMAQAIRVAAWLGMRQRGIFAEEASEVLRRLDEREWDRCEELEHNYPALSAEIKRVFALQEGTN